MHVTRIKKTLRTLSSLEIKDLWDFYVRGCRDTLTQANFDCIVKEAYSNISASFSDYDSESSSSGSSVEVLMEIIESFDQVVSYDHNFIDEMEIPELRPLKNVSSIGNEDNVILEPCIQGECVCIARPKGVKNEYFHFYVKVLEDFNIHIPFIDFNIRSGSELELDIICNLIFGLPSSTTWSQK